ncbi:MAG: RNA-directed polymerase, partial [Herbinix sp.]|nr:RNA-directed polymerase [Herbinix sp.]
SIRKGLQMGHKWNVEYFCRAKLNPAEWLYNKTTYGQTIEEYIENGTKKWKKNKARQIEKLKSLGKEYYTKERLQGIAINKALVTT